MSDPITYNPGAVADFATDVASRAGQLQGIFDDTSNRTNALQEFFAGHGASGFFEAQAQMLSGLQGSSTPSASTGRPRRTCSTAPSAPTSTSPACSDPGR